MARVKFVPPRHDEAPASEVELAHHNTEDEQKIKCKGKGEMIHQEGASLGSISANSQAPTPPTTSVTQEATIQRPSQNQETRLGALGSAVVGLQIGSVANYSSSTHVASAPASSSASVSQRNANTTNANTHAVSKPRGRPKAARSSSQILFIPQGGPRVQQGNNKRKRQTTVNLLNDAAQAESNSAPLRKRARGNKAATRALSISETPSSSTKTSNFNIFEAIIKHPHIVFHFADFLEVEDLITIYTMAKGFHHVINTGLTTVIVAQAMRHAPASAKIFPFRCYNRLCISDPRVEIDQSRGQSRLVPSFRWLRMVCWREKVVRGVMNSLTNEGLYLPWQCEDAIKKLWFLMDIADNRRRLGTIQNTKLWTTTDLFYAVMFLIRIDMRFTEPTAARSLGGLRRLLIAQPSMSVLHRTLERTAFTTHYEVIQAYLRWQHEPRDNTNRPVYGVPRAEIGRMQYEGYGSMGNQVKLQRPDELVLKECIRRDIEIAEAVFDIIAWPAYKKERSRSFFA
ncbi:hypothetical protein BGW36DRAFT_372258 [Talaromyces proteolyticus]|uniref:Uncharacterized protein n=1 Tax=Talaromyces proteolyticus TaxID=1131652 RepID=A0AAD4KXL2_9EURO|nr:uncharacterized protein BGW36DRAFT_372258 [Talaromyces proteolyticus]KAH8702130.1 hypothetical protein BGW36DRAFT_372258 [Talaromyces proteolyticus]